MNLNEFEESCLIANIEHIRALNEALAATSEELLEKFFEGEEITLEDMGSSSDEDIWIMEDTHINELVEEEGQRLIFVFDYLTERSFFMELKSIITGKTLMDPLCTRKEGKAPNQHVDLDEFDARMDKKAAAALEDFDADFYGDTEFNEEELGEGFDDLTFN